MGQVQVQAPDLELAQAQVVEPGKALALVLDLGQDEERAQDMAPALEPAVALELELALDQAPDTAQVLVLAPALVLAPGKVQGVDPGQDMEQA